MGKGDKPRNCFSKDFRDNYDGINWVKWSESDEDCDTTSESVSTIEGMIRQSLDIPLESADDQSENESCANE